MLRAPDIRTICLQLLAEPRAWDAPVKPGVGLYAVFLKTSRRLRGIELDANRLLYVGMTENCFTQRNHFQHLHSGGSSPRRTLGALLREELRLAPRPRGADRRYANFRFADEEEARLSDWMCRSLKISRVELDGAIRPIERQAIVTLEPPLNLTDWQNPQRRTLKQLRAQCAAEAKLFDQRS
jgi:hypothetical protein